MEAELRDKAAEGKRSGRTLLPIFILKGKEFRYTGSGGCKWGVGKYEHSNDPST